MTQDGHNRRGALEGFNTASGMRSHVTIEDERDEEHAVLVSIPQAV